MFNYFVIIYFRVILTWYNMKGNTDFMFDGPQSRENEFRINESEQLVCNPPKELRNSSLLQYYAGRSCYLKVNRIYYYYYNTKLSHS